MNKKFFGIIIAVIMMSAALAIAQDGPASSTPQAAAAPQATETAAAPQAESQAPAFEPFYVYTDKNAKTNHYIPSGWMGDYSDLVFSDASLETPHSGNSCIKVIYKNKASQGSRWAGMYWQNPPNNWGEKQGGFDLTGAKKLTFWARGEKGGERLEEVKIGGINGTYSDTDTVSAGPLMLTKEWQQYTIDLSDADLTYISGGFCWAANLDENPDGATFYIDDIRYE